MHASGGGKNTREPASQNPSYTGYYVKVQLKVLDDYVPCHLQRDPEVSMVWSIKENEPLWVYRLWVTITNDFSQNETKVLLLSTCHPSEDFNYKFENSCNLALSDEFPIRCQTTVNATASLLMCVLKIRAPNSDFKVEVVEVLV